MKWFRRFALSLVVIILVALSLAAHYYYVGFYRPSHAGRHTTASLPPEPERERIDAKAAEQRPFLAQHGFNTGLCFLVDMRLASGKNRFFVYDMNNDSILLAGLVAHGCGNRRFSTSPIFSNQNGSNCTSLGRYRIGFPYQGQFGRSYKLYGLDSTNNQAFLRNIVLHPFAGMPEAETAPYPICNSRGCPMVAATFMRRLQPLIDRSKRPILLCIFD